MMPSSDAGSQEYVAQNSYASTSHAENRRYVRYWMWRVLSLVGLTVLVWGPRIFRRRRRR